jgi:hypothetical protein
VSPSPVYPAGRVWARSADPCDTAQDGGVREADVPRKQRTCMPDAPIRADTWRISALISSGVALGMDSGSVPGSMVDLARLTLARPSVIATIITRLTSP